ncbi:MAG: homoserine kinase [Gemmatimonadaceae bacterium]|nr:homoserine kinase [Gemmatimonadaceae bacterium]
MSRTDASVRVPASTSNLGGGFDCVGMAVDRWLSATVRIDPSSRDVTMIRRGSLTSLHCAPTDDLLYEGFVAACRSREVPVPAGLAFDVTSDIPVARGLGSSAAALVAGAALADAALALQLDADGVATLVSQIEGHPDNAAPAVFGGAMLGVARDDATPKDPCTYAFSSLPVHPWLSFIFAVPSLEVTTASARAVLPDRVSFRDAVNAVQRSAALVHGLSTGDADLLSRALDDVLHVPYRQGLVPGYAAVVTAARAAGAFGGTLSGSGSAMVAIGRPADASAIAAAMQAAFAAHRLDAVTIITAGTVAGLQHQRSPRPPGETSVPVSP